MEYKTRDGDMVDRICHQYYGDRPGATEAVLEANLKVSGKSLAEWGPVLPAGLVINLPDLPAAAKAATVQLWD